MIYNWNGECATGGQAHKALYHSTSMMPVKRTFKKKKKYPLLLYGIKIPRALIGC
jgi:hypothetical protein